MIEKRHDGSWHFSVYVWKEDGSDAELAPTSGMRLALQGAPNNYYRVPSVGDCKTCHEGPAVPVLGFTALQLSPDRDSRAPHSEPRATDEVDLYTLVELGLIRNLSQTLIDQPPRIRANSDDERAALGYLHANCGHCHNDPAQSDGSVLLDLLLAQYVTRADSSDAVLRSLKGMPGRFQVADASAKDRTELLTLRMRSRDSRVQMPPLGSQIPDVQSLSLIERWISTDLNLKGAHYEP